MLWSGEAQKIRSEIVLIESRISEVNTLISKVHARIERARDELGDEEDVRSTKGENRTFYFAITRNVTRLRAELDELYGTRSDLFAERDELWERKRVLYDKLNGG